MRQARWLLALVLVAGASLAVVLAVPGHGSTSPSFRIDQLHGSVLHQGSLYWLRLRARVCHSHPLSVYPEEIDVGHYHVYKGRWWAARTVRDHAPWLVPLGETWHGRHCGPVVIEDPLTPEHYGVESIGNPIGCYGASLTLVIDDRRASKRTIVTCGSANP
jgi:hypothetical protein